MQTVKHCLAPAPTWRYCWLILSPIYTVKGVASASRNVSSWKSLTPSLNRWENWTLKSQKLFQDHAKITGLIVWGMEVLGFCTLNWINSQKDRGELCPSFYSTDAGKGLDRVVREKWTSPTSCSVLWLAFPPSESHSTELAQAWSQQSSEQNRK